MTDYGQDPYQRGEADCWYGRPPNPHKWDAAGRRVEELTQEETQLYNQGFDDADRAGDFAQKDWN